MTYLKSIWKVPLFLIIAGIVDFRISIQMLLWAITREADGTISSDNTKVLIVYLIIFLVTFLIGGIFFRKMTRKEIFISSSVMVIYHAVLLAIQYFFSITSGPAAVYMIYLFQPFEMYAFISQLGIMFNLNLWLLAFIEIFAPYLFIVFGKKSI